MRRAIRVATCSVIGLVIAAMLLGDMALAAGLPPVEGWQQAVLVDPTTNFLSSYVELSVNATGAALAMWYEWNSTLGYPWANAYTPGLGWGTPTLLSQNGTTPIRPPSLSLGDDGTGFAAWTEGSGSNLSLFVARYAPTGAWEPPIQLDGPGAISSPKVVATNTGDGFLFWTNGTVGGARAMAAQYAPETGWLSPSDIFPVPAGTHAFVLDGGATASGSVVALVGTGDGNDTNLSARSFVPGSGWQPPVALETNASLVSGGGALAVARNGAVMVAWTETDFSTVYQASSRGFTPSGGWGPTEILANMSFVPVELAVGVDGAGNASAVWTFYDGLITSVAASHYTPTSGWSTARELDAPDYQDASSPALAVAGNGIATAVWAQQQPGGGSFAYARLASDGSWSNAAPIPTPHPFLYLAIGCDASGAPLLAFGDGYDLFSISYLAREYVPPALAVSSPADGADLGASALMVTGTSEPGATVTVNGVIADVAADGAFRAVIALLPGASTVRVTSTDAWGNSAEVILTVNSSDPVTALQAAVIAAEAMAATANATAAAAEAQASASSSAAAAAQAQAAALQLELNATKGALARAEADAAAANASAEDLRTRVSALEASSGANGSAVADAERRASEAQGAAGSALGMALAAMAVGAAGVALGAITAARSRRKPPAGGTP